MKSSPLAFSSDGFDRLTHYLFRYPAKFHPPVVRKLLEIYSNPGDQVLDPFCGSGSLLVEASTMGRHAVGVDVDPLAVLVARAKTLAVAAAPLRQAAEQLLAELENLRRPPSEYETRKFADLTDEEYQRELAHHGLVLPPIPRLAHWFRRYVAVDLALILREIRKSKDRVHLTIFEVVYAGIIRNCSNADPIPVSGLEVTSHMRAKESVGRLVDPFDLFSRRLRRSLTEIARYQMARSDGICVDVCVDDVTSPQTSHMVDAVITSPPYHNAVDYYRRHQLEMFWLGLTKSQTERLELKQRYVGRDRVPKHHPFLAGRDTLPPGPAAWEDAIRAASPTRADSFHHYCVSMARSMRAIRGWVCEGAPVVFVVGKSSWGGFEIPTPELLAELADSDLRLIGMRHYEIKNRYMSYSRHNGANINREYVLEFRAVGQRE